MHETRSVGAGSLYDPHGWLTPLTLPAKLFFQELWIYDYNWDTPLSAEHQDRWRTIQESTNEFRKRIPRKEGNLDELAMQS
ncbi:hypothetical protein RB195_011587 [Necator americanus]|uniref:Uncharacterized protein n=1 Tax=Necator americanus TaxID=51031 RepID=A0ABR1D341_NECAM